jgi:hypothetical protein
VANENNTNSTNINHSLVKPTIRSEVATMDVQFAVLTQHAPSSLWQCRLPRIRREPQQLRQQFTWACGPWRQFYGPHLWQYCRRSGEHQHHEQKWLCI